MKEIVKSENNTATIVFIGFGIIIAIALIVGVYVCVKDRKARQEKQYEPNTVTIRIPNKSTEVSKQQSSENRQQDL